MQFVDPTSPYLIDRTGRATVATTDPIGCTMYISRILDGDFLNHVVIHELGHCAMVSYGLLDEIHATVAPQYWIEAEEWICNFVADYGRYIYDALREIVGDDALDFLPKYIDEALAG